MGELKTNKLTVLVLAFLVVTSIASVGTAAEIIVKPGNSIQDSINSAASGDTIIVKSGTYTENIKITKSDLTIRSESGNPDDTVIKAKNSGDNVILLQADKVKINGLKISGSIKYGYSGIFLSSSSRNCKIENNKLLSNSFGIYLSNSKGNTISKNTVSDSDRGIYFLSSEDNTVSGNTATGNEEYGILLQNSAGNVVSGNLVFKNERGVSFGNSDSNTFTGNTVRNNNVYGFSICGGCDKCLIYNNYFNDTTMTIGNGAGNAYNITKTAGTNIVGGPYLGGNYWAKPDGTGFSQKAVDKNEDGISDSAYTRISGSKYSDFLPLVITNPSEQKIPVADFWGSPKSGDAPLSVTFTDISKGSPTAWKWDFGDGTYSTEQNPVYKYSKAGIYSVTLTASNTAGSDTIIKHTYINVTASMSSEKSVADFWGSPRSGNAPFSVAFSDSSTGMPTSWSWNFGDGTTSTDKNPAHTYNKAGKYTVSLTVRNTAGSDSIIKSGYIVVNALKSPVAAFSVSPTSGKAPLKVTFTDKSTGSPTSWSWNFGDGTSSTANNPVHTYSKIGKYTVSLTVKNAGGSNAITKSSYIVVLTPPVAAFTASSTSGKAPLKVQFTDRSTGSPTSWKWSFGDGTYSTSKNPTHAYNKAGKYTVYLTVTNSAGSNSIIKSGYITAK